MSERDTQSDQGPSYAPFEVHRFQNFSVVARDDSAFIAAGSGRCDGPCVRTKGTVVRALTSNSPTVVRSTPRRGTGVRRTTMSGPAMARSVPSGSVFTQGTLLP